MDHDIVVSHLTSAREATAKALEHVEDANCTLAAALLQQALAAIDRILQG